MNATCINCEHWDSRDSLSGYCQPLTDAVHDHMQVQGLATLSTRAGGACALWEASAEAIVEDAVGRLHQADLRAEAGDSYPGSLGRGHGLRGEVFRPSGGGGKMSEIIPPCASPENCAVCGTYCPVTGQTIQQERED